MDFSYNFQILPIISSFVFFLLLCSSVFSAMSAAQFEDFRRMNQTFRPGEESKKMRLIRTHLMKINKPSVKSIESPDGDVMDCVLVHHQPAFDHPVLKGTKPFDPPERPDGYNHAGTESENYQLWSLSGESCPEGTIPIRRTTERDILRANSIQRFGRKIPKPVRRDSSNGGHEHAVGYVSGEEYYGAKASINVWDPKVGRLAQSSMETTILDSSLIGQRMHIKLQDVIICYVRVLFKTNNKIAIGAAISPTSSYNGGQFDISLLIWKDPKHGNWWLEFGSGVLVGYWPADLFTHLRDHASMVQFGGEVVNSQASGSHTSTEMGSGHFSGEGFGKASYFRNMQVVDWDNSLIPLSNLKVLADNPNCYDIRGGINNVWGNYIYYGGPGKNPRCP
ncbi:unnamed protein product [Lactuca virosa]|uniref:Neprosin PEP catalytic domain-containing protein n=1 Tax=Lactuca virosa TaxID=75947 RepID=A0AAU9LH94_9ASTR|nr:unnamed protein product [Lactuca virosa]